MQPYASLAFLYDILEISGYIIEKAIPRAAIIGVIKMSGA
jgi:hypothetical protein